MWKAHLIFAVVGLACLACIIIGAYSAGYQKAKKEKMKDLSKALWAIGGIVLCVCISIFWLTTQRTTVRQRLNEPVTSEAQLYGYEIIDKRYFKEKASFDSPEESTYLIDIRDLLSSYSGVFTDVEVSEEIYTKIEKGKSYLPGSDPNTPTLQEQ